MVGYRSRLLMSATLIVVMSASASGQTNAGTGNESTSGQTTADDGRAPSAVTPEGQLQDIVVTARRREESLMKVPVAVTVISGAELQQAGANNLSKISELAPQVIVSRASSGTGGLITIRGIGTSNFDASLEQSVSINIDGVQAGRGVLVNQGFFDLGRVEVLKGPQALFFGKNSPAGVIALHSADPTNHLEGYIRGGYEFVAHERYGEAAVGGPLTDTLKARIAIRASDMDGFMRNTAPSLPDNPFYPGFGTLAGPDRNGGQELLGRVTLLYTPSSNFSANLKVSASRFKDNGASDQAVCGPNQTFPRNFIVPIIDTYGDCKFDDRYTNVSLNPAVAHTVPGTRDGTPYTDTWAVLTALTMNYHLENIDITSVTGYTKLKYDQATSFSNTSYGTSYGALIEDTRTVSQELRAVSSFAGPWNFTLGGYYEDLRRTNGLNQIAIGSGLGADPATGKYDTWEVISSNKGETLSAFGQLRYSPIEQIELAAGVRYTHETKSATTVNAFVNSVQAAFFGLRAQGSPLSSNFRDDNWSPEVTLSWKPGTGTLVYGAFKTGYKSGGLSNSSVLLATATSDSLAYRSENVSGGEIGLKSFLANRAVRIELTAYDYLFKDLQVSAFNQLTLSSYLTNAASARDKGVEFEAEWAVAHGLRVNGSATYNLARYKSFPNALCYAGQTAATGCAGGAQDLGGQPLTRAPEWTFAGGGNYNVPLASKLMLGLNANASYSSSYHTEEDHAPYVVQRAYVLFNAGARLYQGDAGWEVALIGRNLSNKYYKKVCNGHLTPTDFACQNTRGQELTVQASYRF